MSILFVDHSQIVQLTCLRSGIWGTADTWGKIVIKRRQLKMYIVSSDEIALRIQVQPQMLQPSLLWIFLKVISLVFLDDSDTMYLPSVQLETANMIMKICRGFKLGTPTVVRS
jgi:hypothetical protein